MRVSNELFLKSDFVAQDYLQDFELEDVWHFRAPLAETPGQKLDDFTQLFFGGVPDKGPAAWLFRLREWLGEKFGWDEKANQLPIPGCEESSLRQRIAAPPPLTRPPRDDGENIPFREVANHQGKEIVYELSNETVHAAVHFTTIQAESKTIPQMSVLVKPRSKMGAFYMKLITPFRYAIVYPAMIRGIEKKWASQRT